MRVVRDRAFEAFVAGGPKLARGQRIKHIRNEVLVPGGRAHVRLFEAHEGGRAHPRLRFELPCASDPRSFDRLFSGLGGARAAADVREVIETQLDAQRPVLAAEDLRLNELPLGSENYARASVRVGRLNQFFSEVWAELDATAASSDPAVAYAVRELEALTYQTKIDFDDSDTGTFHAYKNDEPFVRPLEMLLASLPDEGTEALAVLGDAAAESVRRQRRQARQQLDHIMRHKYAHNGVVETDIERSLGALLIDRQTRRRVSEVQRRHTLTPAYERLRISPTAAHPQSGAWLYRDETGGLRLEDGEPVEVASGDVRSAPVPAEQLTFRRAPGDPRLRKGIRLDWDASGYVGSSEIDWVSWAGHCDIKAVLEHLGVTLHFPVPPEVTEVRCDSMTTSCYDRYFLLDLLTSALELGSVYHRLDGTGRAALGRRAMGGSRNDALPDRIQFKGQRAGRGFRWPRRGRQRAFRVRQIQWPDGTRADMGTVFYRYIPDVERVDMRPNPRFLKTVEGDYHIIDITGARLEVDIEFSEVEPHSGYVTTRRETTHLDLSSPDENFPADLVPLGTEVEDAAERLIFRVYWDRRAHSIEAHLYEHVRDGERWVPRRVPGGDRQLSLAPKGPITLSREVKRDNPEQFRTLLDHAFRQAKNLCADTDKEVAVWNGAVTQLSAQRIAKNSDARTEHWAIDLRARFGRGHLEFLLRRDEWGEPVVMCPAVPDDDERTWPDFLWHELPDVGSKAFERGDWLVNETMVERGIIELHPDASVDGGTYVRDDHIKNIFELVFCGLAGIRYTIVHRNKRYGFTDESEFNEAKSELEALRAAVSFESNRPAPERGRSTG